MSYAIASAARAAHLPSSRRAASGLLLFALSASATASAATLHPPRAPTCPLQRDTSPNPAGLRSFSAAAHPAHYSYHVAASFVAKQHRFDAQQNLFTAPLHDPSQRHDDWRECKQSLDKRKRLRSGQDALFYSQVGHTSTAVFGVADGVGGWVESGLDPADFAHGLCEFMSCAARSFPHGFNTTSLHPRDLLQVAYDEVTDDDTIEGGGSTACLAVAEPDGTLEVANLGDSGFMHLGLNAVRHFTQPQTHGFNTPFQLSKTPHRMLVQQAIFGGPSSLADEPKDASVTHHTVRHGDVLVFATDGVWDNLSPQDALGIVSKHMVAAGAWVEKSGGIQVGHNLAALVQAGSGRRADSKSLQAIVATAIAKEAKDTGKNTRRDGPFAKEVQKYYPGEGWHGGKPDDIAAVIAIVLEEQQQQQPSTVSSKL